MKEMDDTPLEILSNLNHTHGTEPKKEQKMSDIEADFHPAESDRITELQATQSMSKKNGATTSLDSKCKHFSHYHKLTFLQHEESKEDESDDEASREESEQDESDHSLLFWDEISDDDWSSGENIKYCNGCNEVMCFPGYACHECVFYLHKSCAELPPKILHPLHPHPLTCSLTDDEFISGETLICDGCRDLYRYGFNFMCSWCGFNLDAKCASKQDQEHHQTFKELTLFPFYHEHALKLCNIPSIRSGFPYCRVLQAGHQYWFISLLLFTM